MVNVTSTWNQAGLKVKNASAYRSYSTGADATEKGSVRDIEQGTASGCNPGPRAGGRVPFRLWLGLLIAFVSIVGAACITLDTVQVERGPGHPVSTSIQVAIATVANATDPARATKSLGPIADSCGGLLNFDRLDCHWGVYQQLEGRHRNVGEYPRGVMGVTLLARLHGRRLVRYTSYTSPALFLGPDARVPSLLGPSPYLVTWGVAQSIPPSAVLTTPKELVVEQRPDKPQVVGSNPSSPTNFRE